MGNQKHNDMKNFLLVPKGPEGQMYLYVDGRIASIVHIPIFTDGDKWAWVTGTFGDPGTDDPTFDLKVRIAYY